ncbi:hypothetical protein C6369_021290 [Rhodococcus rhodochrous]|uniref:hypothetical protein n=1 Tax=Rhodococcus rhodochrous TaxID=1829 RepID=UPI000D076D3A|nr:hypothetical protein [Rhodococcus rhodochrous]AYA26722.1 hypothetical protein C6369_021290 [Rhodococcus rhodochrous]
MTVPKKLRVRPYAPAWQNRAAEKGWTLLDHHATPDCPLRLVNKKCQWPNDCLCEIRANDHARKWRNADGIEFVVWEPYSVTAHLPELAKLQDALRPYGIGMQIDSRYETWNPGNCAAIVFYRDQDFNALFPLS